jgi:hypothetical protein
MTCFVIGDIFSRDICSLHAMPWPNQKITGGRERLMGAPISARDAAINPLK